MGKKIKCILIKIYLASSLQSIAKGIVAELASPHVRSAWGSRGERVRVAGLAVCCNYLSQKKKKTNVNLKALNSPKFKEIKSLNLKF